MGLRFGRYETLEPVAAGGMAKVYRGRALAEGGFERVVAIKVMHAHLACDPEFVAMFLDEARLAAKIDHPNVVATHDVQQSPVGTFLVMDYVDGYDFGMVQRCLRSRDERVPLGVALRVVIDALRGLSAAHELTAADGTPIRLVHRDVSPQNILLDKNTGTVRLTDFGVAHARERLSSTEAGALKGKLGYLSPEHAKDGAVDCRSDIYSTGVLLWEALVGKPMFAGRPRVRVLSDILQGNIRPPHVIDPTLPEALSDACMRALALDPEKRFPTAEAFAKGLRAAASIAEVDVADNDAVRDFVATSGVAAYAKRNAQKLHEEEETIVEPAPATPPAEIATTGTAARRFAGRWTWAVAALLALGSFVMFSWPEPAPMVVPTASRFVLEEPLLLVEPAPVLDVDQLARTDEPSSDTGPMEAPQRRKRDASKRVYHPKGL